MTTPTQALAEKYDTGEALAAALMAIAPTHEGHAAYVVRKRLALDIADAEADGTPVTGYLLDAYRFARNAQFEARDAERAS